MEHKQKPGAAPGRGDEIAELAAKYLKEPGVRGLEMIDARIYAAMGDSEWDEVSKWHRVRLRLLRMRQQRTMIEQLGRPGGGAGESLAVSARTG